MTDLTDETTGKIIQFAIQTPLDAEIIAGHIAHAKSLGLPEADGQELPVLRVVASGLSAYQALPEGPTMAVNGGLKVFRERGISPTYWAGCDPQELLSEFIEDPPEATTYLVASKCHPKVFETLKGRDVRLWHLDDYPTWYDRRVPCAVSVTLTAMSLMTRLGWRRFQVWGWDGCYIDGKHHIDDPLYERVHKSEGDVTLEIGDRLFQSTPAWAAEAKDAECQLGVFEWMGIEVEIMGDGAIKAFRELGRKAA